MARLMLRFLAVAALLFGSSAVLAEPVSGFLAATLFTVGGVAVSVGTALYFAATVAYSVYGSIQARKKARAMAQRAAEVEAANLKDRTTTLMVSDAPWAVVYGSPAPIGGSIVAMLTSGPDDRFKHVVFVLAAHECDGVEAIYMGGDWVGNLDAQGYAGGAEFALDAGVPRVETHEFTLAAVLLDSDSGQMSPDGYWMLPLAYDADGFALDSIRNPAGQDYGTTVILDYAPDNYSGRALKGPIGAKGTITYTVNGGGSALNIQIHNSPGGVDTADAFLRAARPDLWTVDHKLSGFTYIVVTMNLLLERFQGGVPEITAKVRGKRVYDYRTGQTAYSRNPALCLADFIRSEAGYGADVSQIDIDAVVAAANACDVNVYDLATVIADPATYGGSTVRYTCDGMFRSDQDRDATRQQIEDAMVGFSLESGGVWRIQAGAWSTPVLALGDDDMVMPMSVVQSCNVGTARYNGAKGTYVNAVRNGVTEDFTPYVNANFRAQDVKDKFLDATLSFTGNHVRTQQISRVLVEQSRGGFVVTVSPKMFAWNLQPGDRVVLSNALYGFTNKPFRVQDWTYQAGTPVALQCVEDEEAFYDQADETRADAAPNTQLPNPFLKPAPPLDLVILSGESQMIQQDGVMVVRTLVRWAQSQDQYVLQYANGVHIQWRQAGTDDAWQNITLPGDATEQYLLGLEVNRVYVIRVAFVTPYASSTWSVAQHEVHGLEGPPNSVLGLTVQPETTGIFAYWTEPVGIDLLGWSATQIRRGLTWELAEANILFDGRASSANLGWFPAGSQLVWAAHHNTTEKWSEPVFDTIEILPPKQPIPTITVENRNTVVIRLPGDYKGTQPLLHFEVLAGAVGSDISDAVVIDRALKTRFEFIQPQFGEKMYWVVAVDVALNRSAPGYATALTLASYDSAIGSVRGLVNASTDKLAAIQMRGAMTADGKLEAVRAGVYSEIEVLKTDTSALATQYTAVAAAFNEFQAIASSQVTSLANGQSAQSSRIDIVAAVNAQNTAAIVVETNARVNAVSAVATQVTTVQSSVGTLSGTVQTQSNTLANLNGNVAAQHMIRTEVVTALGIRAIAGLSLGVSSTGGGSAVQSTVAVFAGQFLVLPDASATVATAPFEVSGGITRIKNAIIGTANIDTLNVAGFALTISLEAEGAGIAALSFTVPVGQIWRATSLAVASSGPAVIGGVLDRYMASLSLTGRAVQTVPAVMTLFVESESGSAVTYISPPIVSKRVQDYGAGTHTITAQWTCNAATSDVPVVNLSLDLQKRGA